MIEILHMQHAKEEPVSITALFFIFKQGLTNSLVTFRL